MKLFPRDRILINEIRLVTLTKVASESADTYNVLDENGTPLNITLLDSSRALVRGEETEEEECRWTWAANHRVEVLRKALVHLDKRVLFPLIFTELLDTLYESTWIRLRQDEHYEKKTMAEKETILEAEVDKELIEITKDVPRYCFA